jgi:hypothetical protein
MFPLSTEYDERFEDCYEGEFAFGVCVNLQNVYQ